MKTIQIKSVPGFDEWRLRARESFLQGYRPDEILWQESGEAPPDLFAACGSQRQACGKNFSVPKEFLESASLAACHAAPERYALLYRLLWRLCRENKHLLHLKTDDDILALQAMVKAVRRDAYKIKAFLRFREVQEDGGARFIAWYEPEHYSLELSLPFFQTRFKNMNWSILTPYRGAHWDRERLLLTDNPDPSQHPQDDEIEKYWLSYYASTFNPARPKKQAMLNQMPKKYWKNMPETVLIKDLLNNSEARARKMIEAGQGKPPPG